MKVIHLASPTIIEGRSRFPFEGRILVSDDLAAFLEEHDLIAGEPEDPAEAIEEVIAEVEATGREVPLPRAPRRATAAQIPEAKGG